MTEHGKSPYGRKNMFKLVDFFEILHERSTRYTKKLYQFSLL